MDPDTQGPYDYVVVGAGSAGCVLADRLTDGGLARVLLLEAGGETKSVAVTVPALIQKLSSELNWLYPTEPDPSRNGISDPYSAGRGIGGSSVVNAMMWVRGNPADFDGWAAAGAEGWDYRGVLPYFRRTERFEGGGSAFRGNAGRVRVARTHVDHPMIGRFVQAAGQVGFPILEDFNAELQMGVSLSQVNQRRGLRHSVAGAYLTRARRRANLTVVSGATATRILVERGRAVGVAYRRSGSMHVARARAEVLVCAGAIGSPKLLLLSGIGPRNDLERLGITVVADTPAVGTGLQEHPATSLVYEVTDRTLNQDVTPLRLLRHGLDFLLRGRGALTTTANHAVAFGRIGKGLGPPDTQLVFMAFGLDEANDTVQPGSRLARATARSGGRPEGRRQAATAPLVTVTAVLLHPAGRGQVSLRSADPADPPLIRQSMLGEDTDLQRLARAARLARQIFAAPALARYVVRERTPGALVVSDEDWASALPAATFRMFHAAGTCRMGADDDAVVDARLRLRGLRSLRVIDASIMPEITSGNTQAPTVMIAEKASDLIISDNVVSGH